MIKVVSPDAIEAMHEKLRGVAARTANELQTALPPVTRAEFKRAHNLARHAVGLRPDRNYPTRGRVPEALRTLGLDDLAEATAHPTPAMQVKKLTVSILGAVHEMPGAIGRKIDEAALIISSFNTIRASRPVGQHDCSTFRGPVDYASPPVPDDIWQVEISDHVEPTIEGDN